MTTDPKREAFEKWASDDGKWPAAVEWNGNGYELMQTHAAWIAWQASWQAAFSQPPERQIPTLEEINAQQWAKVDPAIAFHLIERHAEDWNHAGRLMEAWRLANSLTAPSAGHGEGWRPISEAPKDGTEVLLLCLGIAASHGVCVLAWYENVGESDEGWFESWDGKPLHMNPTHFMPLPPTPKDNRHE